MPKTSLTTTDRAGAAMSAANCFNRGCTRASTTSRSSPWTFPRGLYPEM